MDDHGDITDALAPKSEQLDNIELASGPRIFTVESVTVRKGTEQPVSVHLVGFPRPWKPSKNMLRVLAYCWSEKSVTWAGRSAKLFRDPDVTYGKDKPGGTRIAALSHIDGPKSVPLIVSQGRTALYDVEPLTDIATCTNTAELGAMWKASGPEMRARIEARVAELKQPTGPLIPEGAAQ